MQNITQKTTTDLATRSTLKSGGRGARERVGVPVPLMASVALPCCTPDDKSCMILKYIYNIKIYV